MIENLPAEVLRRAVAETLLGRLAEPEDVARVVASSARKTRRHVTGEVVRVDGGQTV
jgi:3-oxoacyl-[acyl-carrier protein] reductase